MPEVQADQDGSLSTESGAVQEEAAKIDQARAELYDEATGQQAEGSGENLILGKYKSQEDLVQAYQSLQAEYTKLKGSVPETPAPEAQEAPADEPKAEGRQLSADDAYRIRDSMFEQVGGEERYRAIAGWAATNLPSERLTAFNDALSGGDQGTILNQLKGLQYDHMMATGYEPKLTGGRAPSNEVKGFASEAQVVEAMQDPRYSGSNPDPAYIKEIERRIAASNVFSSRG